MFKEFEKYPRIDILAVGEKGNFWISALSEAPKGSELKKYLTEKVLEAKLAKVTDPTNKKYANRIAFSTEKIPSEAANISKFLTKLQVGKNIYARLYLGSLYSDHFYGAGDEVPIRFLGDINIIAKIEGDEQQFGIHLIKIKDLGDASTYEISVNTDDSRQSFHRLFMRLKTGETLIEGFI